MTTRAEVQPVRVDAMVLAALGALARFEQLDRFVEAALEAPAGEKIEPEDPALLAVLGLVSLRRTTVRWLELAAADAQPSSEGHREPAPQMGLLR